MLIYIYTNYKVFDLKLEFEMLENNMGYMKII